MIAKGNEKKGILAKILEQFIRVLIKKECKEISNLKINIFSSSTQIIKGEIQKINIIAEYINYKDLFFDEVKLETNHLKINFILKNKELNFVNNPIIKFKISLSQNSLKKVLLSNNWNWIGNIISKGLLEQGRLEDIRIINDKLFLNTSKNDIINQLEQINIKAEEGKVYLENRNLKKTIQIPIEDKIYIKNVKIYNNIVSIFANSSISF
tara:strand:+ start:2102 stop:2731 length:630 start_codon:yes stop_codon:yes gene_type:complete